MPPFGHATQPRCAPGGSSDAGSWRSWQSHSPQSCHSQVARLRPRCAACARYREVLDELLAMRAVAATERAGVRPDHRFAQRVMQDGQEKGVAYGCPRPWPDHVVRTVPAARHGDVGFVVGVARLKRQDRQDDLWAVEFREALRTAELVKLLGTVSSARNVATFQFGATGLEISPTARIVPSHVRRRNRTSFRPPHRRPARREKSSSGSARPWHRARAAHRAYRAVKCPAQSASLDHPI